jgi:hypothetical protein
MAPFSSFVDPLAEIEDPRGAEGKLYRLPHVVLFAILAIVAGANSYRTIHSFIDVHLARLREAFGVKWQKAPAYTTIRGASCDNSIPPRSKLRSAAMPPC